MDARASVTANTPPANDSYAAASPISGLSGALDADNGDATRQLGEPIAHNNWTAGGHSVWYRWTVPTDGDYSFATSTVAALDAATDTLIRIFQGDDLGTATPVAENDDTSSDNYLSKVTFYAVVGREYHLAVDAWDYLAASGLFHLVWDQVPRRHQLPAPRRAPHRAPRRLPRTEPSAAMPHAPSGHESNYGSRAPNSCPDVCWIGSPERSGGSGADAST